MSIQHHYYLRVLFNNNIITNLMRNEFQYCKSNNRQVRDKVLGVTPHH